nr:trypsin-like peptidase domain-containing protein [Clostridia bacterium]
VLSFKSEPSCFAPAKKSKGHKGLLTVLSVALIVCISFASGAAGAFIVNNTTATPAETTVSVSPSVDAIGQTYLTTSTDSGAYTSVAAAAKPTVVEITTEMATGGSYFQQYITSGAGSGVIITSDGYIITNNHVIDGATKITVRLSSGVEYPATLIGADAQSDIAVIKIEEIALPHATIGNSSALAVGEEVLAIGNPLGTLGGSVTNGIISALGREITVDGQKMTLLQTNAAINPGNSGGGLFNMNGELVAIVNAKSSGESIEGLGFAIPINDAYSIAQALMENGYVLGRPALGISYIAINDYMDLWRYGVSSYGIYVYDGGETGLENGDRIVRIGDYEVADTATLKSAIQNYKVGDTVNITVVRRGRYADVSVTLIENKPAETKIELQANN